MKKGKFLIPALAMLMCVSVSAGVGVLQADDASPIAVKAEDGMLTLALGDNTVAVSEDAVSEGMVLAMFTVEEADTYTFISDDFNISVGDMEGNVIGSGSLELASGTYFILLGTDTISAAGDYVATIIRGVPEAEPTVHAAGKMYTHESGIGNNVESEFAFYFKTDANDAAYNDNWSLEYGATSADNIKLTRNGETTSVAVVGQGMIVRLNATDHYMKFAPWTVSNVLPVQEGDVFTISGAFKCTSDATQMFEITETTVTYKNGTLRYSTDPTIHEAGQMYAHEAGFNAGENGGGANGAAFYFKTEANGAAYNGDWSKEYGATSADNIKLTRNGETTSVAVVGQGTIVRYSETDHYMKLVPWTVSGLLPLQEGDVLTISGAFKCTSDATQMFEITETTVTYTNGKIKFSTDPTVHSAGQMYTHANGVNLNEYEGNGFGFYFKTEANGAAYNSDWSIEYGATSADNIKLTRNGVTTSVAVVGQGTIVRYSEIDHYMKFVPWTTSGVLPIQEGDVFTISGTFKCTSDEKQMFEITETTVTFTNGVLKYSTDVVTPDPDPTPDPEPDIDAIEAGQLYNHSTVGTANGFYFTTTPNDGIYNEDWSVEYKPVSADNVKITRGGETMSVANTEAGTIVKTSDRDYYLKFDSWMNSNFPLQDGDVITVSGLFYKDSTYINFTETVVTYTGGAFAFSTDTTEPEEPDEPEVPDEPVVDAIEAGQLYNHSTVGTANGFYFTTTPNDGIYNVDWSVEYKPVSADNVKITRGGETMSVANTGAGTIVKLSDRDYYLKFDAWMNGNFPLQDGDVITVSGLFYKDSTYINFTETVVTYTDGAFKFSTDAVTPDPDPTPDPEPDIDAIEAGQMYVHNNGGNGNQGVYFTLTENALPYDGWNLEYTATSADNIKLTRNGETFNVANVSAGIIVKFGATDYYLKMEGWLNEHFPMQEGDVLTISGTFRARDSEADYFVIAETSITYEYGLYQFSTADEMEIIKAGYMYAHPYATNSATGLHFSMNENGSMFSAGWDVEYSSVTADAVRLIRGGQTINVGNMDAGTIVKFSATEYYIKFENWINGNFPVQNGDVIVVDGLFKCKASDDIIKIDASYIRVEESEEGYTFKFLNPSVTFLNNDGTVLSVSVYAYEAGVLAEKPEVDPTATAEGYTCSFLGWYNGETAWNFETDTVTTAVVLQAKYEMVAIEYKASFVADGETVEEITFTVENMGAIALPTVPAKEGYIGKWDKTLADITLADITFTAVYEEVEEPSNPPVDDGGDDVTPPADDEGDDVTPPADSGDEATPPADEENPTLLDKIAGVIPQPVKDLVGCQSVIGGVAGGVAALGLAAAALLKKKDDEE